MDTEMTTQEIARELLAIQDASNLRGVLRAWHKMLCSTYSGKLEDEGPARFAVNVLMLSKVASLLRLEADAVGSVKSWDAEEQEDTDAFGPAYQWARLHAQEDGEQS